MQKHKKATHFGLAALSSPKTENCLKTLIVVNKVTLGVYLLMMIKT